MDPMKSIQVSMQFVENCVLFSILITLLCRKKSKTIPSILVASVIPLVIMSLELADDERNYK